MAELTSRTVSPSTRQSLPTGTVTFLFTDIEGSTRLVQSLGDGWVPVLETHNHLIEEAITGNNGVVVKTEGDSFFAVFAAAVDALQASVQAQHALMDHPWPADGVVRSRMGLHTGIGALGASDYVGLDVHRAARIADSAHGGQVVLSEPTAVLVERSLPEDVSLRDLGKHRLKDLAEPEAILQVVSPGLQSEFPLLRTLDAIPNNLPKLLTSFVGRDRELSEAVRLLERDPDPDLHRPRRDRQDSAVTAIGSRGGRWVSRWGVLRRSRPGQRCGGHPIADPGDVGHSGLDP